MGFSSLLLSNHQQASSGFVFTHLITDTVGWNIGNRYELVLDSFFSGIDTVSAVGGLCREFGDVKFLGI
jgi:hypothetical protein